jgi:hypothetical protein
MDILFDKANRFLDKRSIKKVKEEMKNQMKLKYMTMNLHSYKEEEDKINNKSNI